MSQGSIVNFGHIGGGNEHSIIGVVGTLGTADTSGTALTIPFSADATTGAMYVYPVVNIAGEDGTVNVLKTEQRFSYSYISAAGTNTIKATPGLLHSMTVMGGTAGTIALYDSASGTNSTYITNFDSTASLQTYTFNALFLVGLVIANGAATRIVLSYR